MTKNELLNAVVELAHEIDKADSIDFGMLRITEETAYRFVATNLIEDVTAGRPGLSVSSIDGYGYSFAG